MKRLSISLVLLSIALTVTVETGSAGEFQWLEWNDGLAKAKKSGLPVLVDVYTDWCGWCKRMDRDVYTRREVRDYLGKQFVTIKLDAESSRKASYQGKELTARSLAARSLRVTGYPTTVFLKPDGAHLVNVPGYIPADKFRILLEYIGEGHYERGVPFDQFARDFSARK